MHVAGSVCEPILVRIDDRTRAHSLVNRVMGASRTVAAVARQRKTVTTCDRIS